MKPMHYGFAVTALAVFLFLGSEFFAYCFHRLSKAVREGTRLWPIVVGSCFFLAVPSLAATVTINPAQQFQTILDWGVTTALDIPTYISQPDKALSLILEEQVTNLGLTSFRWSMPGGSNLSVGSSPLFPDPSTDWEHFNDDGDPNHVNWPLFGTAYVDDYATRILVPMKEKVEANGDAFNLYLDQGGSETTPSWIINDPEEYAEFTTSFILYLKDTYGITARFTAIRNEPENGSPFTPAVHSAMIKTLGPKLLALGLPTMIDFSEGMSAQGTWDYIQALQNDSAVWPYIGLLSYHLYGTNDPYRSYIRDFGIANGIPRAQTEYIGLTSDILYDDLTLGGVSLWDQTMMSDLLPSTNNDTWFSRATEYWETRQVTRYVRPGAVRVGASSDSASIRPLAFVNNGQMTVVLFNTTGGGSADITIQGLPAGTYGVCHSIASPSSYVEDGLQVVDSSGNLTVAIPSSSVLTVYPYGGVNLPPVVTDYEANPSYLKVPDSVITLSASAQDPEHDAISYLWSVSAQPEGANVVLNTPNAATTGASGLTAPGDYTFDVAVSDSAQTVNRQVLLTVYSGNQPPHPWLVQYRDPSEITLPDSSTTLMVQYSTDLENDPITYQWNVLSQPSGASVQLATPTQSSCVASHMTVAGNYLFQVAVSDPSHTVTANLNVPVYPANVPPVISSITATPDSITLPNSSVSLSAITSDPDAGVMAPFRPDGSGDALTHFWSVVSAPAGAQPYFSNAGWPNTSVGNLTVAGTYVFRLAALDRTGMTTQDVTVSVVNSPSSMSETFFPQVAVGGGLDTLFTVTNTGPTAASGILILTDQQGNPFLVSGVLTDSSGTTQPASVAPSFNLNIPAGGTVFLSANPLNPNNPTSSGWAELESTGGSLTGVATYEYVSGGTMQYMVGVLQSPLLQYATIPVDNDSTQAMQMAYAIANPSSQTISINLALVGQDGTVVDDTVTVTLGPGQQIARYLSQVFQARATFKGSLVLEGQAGASFSAVGLLQKQGPFTVIPLITEDEALSSNLFPQVTVGGGLDTLFTVTNAGSTAASGTLILTDQHGNPFAVSGVLTDSSGTTQPASVGTSFNLNIPAGGTVFLSANPLDPSDPTSSGWAELGSTGSSVTGVATYEYVSGGILQYMVGVLQSPLLQFATIPVDNDSTQAMQMAYAIANPSSQTISIKLALVGQDGTVVDDTITVTLGPEQQIAKYLSQVLPTRATFKGSLVLEGQAGASFSAVGLLQKQGLFTVIPLISGKAPGVPD